MFENFGKMSKIRKYFDKIVIFGKYRKILEKFNKFLEIEVILGQF